MNSRWPVVGIPCDTFMLEEHPFHGAGEKYINAVVHGVRAGPILLPALDNQSLTSVDYFSVEDMLDSLDGLLLTGSTSNIEPYHYHESSRPGTEHDSKRDAITLPLIRSAIERNIPILAICRGCQELNVALGGSLHQHLEEVQGMINHENSPKLEMEERYDVAHHVALSPDGLLSELAGGERAMVNSLHQQGINQLAEGLEEEATAPDGLVEAVRWVDHSRFVVGVQWHPEWKFHSNSFYGGLFKAFGDAIRERL